jgi:hypothetical protein
MATTARFRPDDRTPARENAPGYRPAALPAARVVLKEEAEAVEIT